LAEAAAGFRPALDTISWRDDRLRGATRGRQRQLIVDLLVLLLRRELSIGSEQRLR
jgi:hypothetical protein